MRGRERETDLRMRKKAPARGTHHLSSFLYQRREVGELRRLRGRLAN